MRSDLLAPFLPRPSSEVEWEDLLLRLELMPRALRVTLEDARVGSEEVRAVLEELVAREEEVTRFLERATTPHGSGPGLAAAPPQVAAPQDDSLDRFVRLRTRNFAMAQRRGIEIWDWTARVDVTGGATIHQVLAFLARQDVAALAALRHHSRTKLRVC